MIAFIRDWHQSKSWELGYREGGHSSCPWWVDETIYALARKYGKRVEIRPPEQASNRGGEPALPRARMPKKRPQPRKLRPVFGGRCQGGRHPWITQECLNRS
jgi:hypothetical protein